MSKTIGFRKPQAPADAFVAKGKEAFDEPSEPVKRMTLDVPASLHKALKRKAVDDGLTMRELVVQWVREKLTNA
jgi:predicted HicB family RNase H-like nuclease